MRIRSEEAAGHVCDEHSSQVEAYDSFYAHTVIPFVDRTYRTDATAGHRALVGMGLRGLPMLALAIERQDLFGKAGIQSAFAYGQDLGGLGPVLHRIESANLDIYLDWATYDLRNPHENWDIAAANRRIARALTRRGFSVSGGEVADGLGWSNWRQRTDELLEALFQGPRADAETSTP